MNQAELQEQSAGTPPDEPPAEQEVAALAHPSSALALLGVFRHRNYRLFFSGQLVSLMGTWMQSVAQAWLVYRLTHSPLLLGLTSFCAQVTVFFMASFGGMIADRVDRRKMLLVTQGLSMLQAGILAGLTIAGVVQVWEIIALAFGIGLINSVDVPTRQAMTLDMVGRENLRHAIALNSMMFNLARVIGPSLAGALIAVVGEGPCFALNALSFGAVLTSLLLMDLPSAVGPRLRPSVARHRCRLSLLLLNAPDPHGADAGGGVLHVRGRLSVDAAGVCPRYPARRLYQLRYPDDVGRHRRTDRRLWPVAHPRALARHRAHRRRPSFGLGLVLFSHSHVLWLSVLLLLPTACSLMLLGGTTNTIIQIAADEHYRGRVISHYTQSFLGMMPWGSLLLGFLASRIGIGESVTIGGAVVMASAAFAWFIRPRTQMAAAASLD